MMVNSSITLDDWRYVPLSTHTLFLPPPTVIWDLYWLQIEIIMDPSRTKPGLAARIQQAPLVYLFLPSVDS